MPIIDADAHVIENESAWDYMLESERQFRPRIVGATNGVPSVDYWFIDGRLMPRSNVERTLPEAARDMSDLSIRIKQMDALNIDIQVIYPTIFIFPTARRPEVDLALCRSYNRWMADIVKKASDRFRWVVVPPLLNTDRVFDELQFGKEHGACGVYLRGLEADRRLSDSYFFPLYDAASKLDLPICVHSANGSIASHDFFLDEPGFCKFKLAVVGAFHSLINDGIPERFPALRTGIIEVSAQWIPYAIHDLARRHARRGKPFSKNVLKDKRVWVTCQTDDDLDYILGYAGEDTLVIGTDYGHADNASEIEALRKLRADGKVAARVIDKILDDNPRALGRQQDFGGLTMLSIDADAHVIETEKTWDYLEGSDRRYRPVAITVDMPSGKTQNFWIIGGRLIGGRDNIGKDTSKESREMANIDSRLKHMDEIGTDAQILYPTLFLRPVTDNPRIELALCRSYNRWMADIWSKAKERLRWGVQLPLMTMDKALDELRWAHGNGACAVFVRGIETRHTLHDPYFFPLYEEASRLNLPIGIHSGIGNFTINEILNGEPFRVAKLMVIGGFHSMILNGIPERFPKLRIGAIEVAAQWVPYLVHDLNLRFPKLEGKQARPDVLRGSNQLFVACQTDDDLSYVLQYAGENSLMIGSDYGHADNASELLALKRLKDNGAIDPRIIDKILCANPARFYGLD